MTFSDRTADLVEQLNGNGQKGMLQIDAPLSKISGYATRRLYILCWREHSRRKLSPTLATAYYSCPDNASSPM